MTDHSIFSVEERLENYRQLVEHSPDAIIVYCDGKVVFANASAQRLLGAKTPSELIGRSLTDFSPTELKAVPQKASKPKTTLPPVEQKFVRLDGSVVDVETATMAVKFMGKPAFQVVVRDISRRKQDENLQEAIYQIAQAAYRPGRLEQLYPTVHEIICSVMPAENFYIALYDEAAQTISFPYTIDEVDKDYPSVVPLGKGMTEYVLRSGRPLFCDMATKQRLLKKGKLELLGTPSLTWLGVPLIVDEKTIGVMAVQHYHDPNAYTLRDLRMLEFVSRQVAMAVERKQTEDALRDSEERFRTLFENVPDGIYRSLPDGRLLAANPALANMLGYPSAKELVDCLWQDVYADPEAFQQSVQSLMREGRIVNREVVLQCRDGKQITCLDNALAIYASNGELAYVEGVVTDVSEQKKNEQALRHRIEALQSLAEIDRSILNTGQPDEILALVCKSAASLLAAPQALILSLQDNRIDINASYGITDRAILRDELLQPKTSLLFREDCDAAAFGSLAGAPDILLLFREREQVASMAFAPFVVETTATRGVLFVFDTCNREWGDEQAELMKLLAGQAAIGLEKTNLFKSVQSRANEFSVLYDIALDLTNQHDINSLLPIILEHAMELLNAPSASLYLYDAARDELEMCLSSGLDITSGVRMKMGEGLAGKVALTRRPMRLDDYASWEYRSPQWSEVNFTAALQVPMLYGGELIGVLAVSVIGRSDRKFTEDDERLLYLFAGQAAGAIYNSRLFSEISRANQELDRLYQATGTLIASVSSDVNTLAQTIASTVVEDFQHSNCAVWLLNENTKDLKRWALAGLFTSQMRLNELRLNGSGIIPRTVRSGVATNVPDVFEDPDYKIGWREARSELCIPLKVNDRVIGALDLQSAQPAAFSAADERLMMMFAGRAGLMLEHARVLEQTERQLQRLTALQAIETAIASSLDLGVTLNILLEQITSKLNVDAAAVLLLEPHLQVLEYAAGRGFDGRGIQRFHPRIGDNYAGKSVLERGVICIPDLSSPDVALAHPERIAGERFVTYFAAPLIAKGQVKGVLELYYRKNFDPDPEWHDFLETLSRQAAVAIDDASMFAGLQKSYTDLMVAYDTSIEVWSRALDLREKESPGHAHRLTDLALHLAREMGVDEDMLPHIYRGVLLHDIGQLSIPDSILLKPGPLEEDEWKIVREHPTRAYEMLFPVVYLHPSLNIPYCHHEHWDGSGYPRGLKGEQIPIEARIFSVVDAWDALCSDRPHRPAWGEQQALLYIREQAGKQFDPAVVDIFMRVLDEMRKAAY